MEYNFNFRQWMELFANQGANPMDQASNDPAVMAVQNQAKVAMQNAVKSGGDPISAAQDIIIKSKLSPDQIGQILPKKPGMNNKPGMMKPGMNNNKPGNNVVK